MTTEYLTPREVEAEYGFKVQTLAQWRWMGLGPAYLKQTPGKGGRIKYKRASIQKWLDEHTVHTGSAA